ncbi:MAG: serine--tRNA ligase [Candidatus Eisenbacteria bacterium]|jgi:seryl-tRNA synthetase|nr:serine--tRNA ligase [Candidatus Eisenbacteria bacterium]
MLDLRRLRQEPERIRAALQAKGSIASLERVLELDATVRKATFDTDNLRAEKNALTEKLAHGGLAGEGAAGLRQSVKDLNGRLKTAEETLRSEKEELDRLVLWLPNIPHESVPLGGGPEGNVVVRTWGEQPSFAFTPAPHWDLGAAMGILDPRRAARISGSNFPLFSGDGALLVRGLITFMLDLHTTEHGYREHWVPYLVNRDAMTGTGQLPKMEEDMYVSADPELFLIPTGEVPLTNLWREEIIPEERLPVRMVGYTPCFRKEAGAYGKETRGLNRVHQFDKVELVKLVEPHQSYDELESLVADAEEVLQRLELPYRVVSLCTGDLSFSAAKCYDLEVWAAGQQRWLEVSSCSNFEDFQARRMGIRYRPRAGGKPQLVHTLNGSGLALPRIIAALIENGQTAEGMVQLPEPLWPYLRGRRSLGPQGENQGSTTEG